MSPFHWRLVAVVATLFGAFVLRGWGVFWGELVWHPDEIFMVVYPLNVLGGDLNPHMFTYPAGHFYLLSVIYGGQYLLGLFSGLDVSLSQWVIERYIWSPETLRDTARWASVACSVATVAAAGMLAAKLSSPPASARTWRSELRSIRAIVAMLLAAVNLLLVRQAGLAGTDTPLALWFIGSTLASLRLLRDGSIKTYALAGALVGICAATKYPGAAAAGGVVAAHLCAGRRLPHLPLLVTAGVVSMLTFLLLSPYTLLDFTTFADHFHFQLAHATEGRWGLQTGPFYHLGMTLRHAHGLVGWILGLLVCLWVLWQRPKPHVVILTMIVCGYVAVSWGELVFARYVLPLIPLQVALLADGIVRSCAHVQRRGWAPSTVPLLPLIVLLVALQPAYGAWHVARLQSTRDTRSAARSWIEAHVPAGSTLCNFGGWAGDPQINTFEGLWWRFKKYSQAYPRLDLRDLGQAARVPAAPFYSYAVQTANEDLAVGSSRLVHDRRCGYAVLNEHPLAYSTVDTSFASELAGSATRAAVFDPGRVGDSIFDPMDAYYVPLAGWDPSAAGPRIEIWKLLDQHTPPRQQDAVTVLSRAVSLNAETSLAEGDTGSARADLARALSLKQDNLHARQVLADLERQAGNRQAEENAYLAMLSFEPDDVLAMQGLAQLYSDRGAHGKAVAWYQRARQQQPEHPRLLNNLAIEFRRAGRQDSAIVIWQQALRLQETYSDAHYNLGTAYFLAGDSQRALPHLNRAVELAPDSVRYHSNTAAAHRSVGKPHRAVELWKRAVQIDSSYVDAHFNIAFTLQYDLRDPAAALEHWRIARRLNPRDAEVALHYAQALLDLARAPEAIAVLRDFLQQHPEHDRRQDISAALAQIRQATNL